MKTDRRLSALTAIALISAAIVIEACDDETSHIFVGNQYEPGLECLDPPAAIDVVAGGEVATNCTPFCLVSPVVPEDAGFIPSGVIEQDGGAVTVFVSTMCGTTPFGFDTTGTSPACAAALAAFTREDLCADGGSTHPPAEAGSDAEVDAAIDATLSDGSNDTGIDANEAASDAGIDAAIPTDAAGDDGG